MKPRSYAPGDIVWLNNKYIKAKRNRKLEAKFFGPFRVLHSVRNQAYKLKLPKKWRIHDYSTSHCWSRTPPGRGGWMRRPLSWSLKQVTATARNSRQCGLRKRVGRPTTRTLLLDSTTWSRGKATLRKKTPGSLLRRLYSTYES